MAEDWPARRIASGAFFLATWALHWHWGWMVIPTALLIATQLHAWWEE